MIDDFAQANGYIKMNGEYDVSKVYQAMNSNSKQIEQWRKVLDEYLRSLNNTSTNGSSQ